jgi:hypothetical protein
VRQAVVTASNVAQVRSGCVHVTASVGAREVARDDSGHSVARRAHVGAGLESDVQIALARDDGWIVRTPNAHDGVVVEVTEGHDRDRGVHADDVQRLRGWRARLPRWQALLQRERAIDRLGRRHIGERLSGGRDAQNDLGVARGRPPGHQRQWHGTEELRVHQAQCDWSRLAVITRRQAPAGTS